MKSTCIFLILLAISSMTMAGQAEFKSKLQSLITMQTKAGDAVDTVNKLLGDLRQSNVNEQIKHDATHKKEVEEGLKEIAELGEIRATNEQVMQDARTHTAFVEQELEDTKNYLAWNANRTQTIHQQTKDHDDQRCYSNGLFVRSIKEHNDADKVIDLLIQDLKDGQYTTSFDQLESVTNGLSSYSHLFNAAALESFMELAREKHEDNNREALKIDEFDSKHDERDLHGKNGESMGDKVVSKLVELKAHLKESLQNLQNAEVKAAYDFAEYQADSERELAELASEQKRKETYHSKLQVDVQAAKQSQAKAEAEYQLAVKNHEDAKKALQAKRDWYAAETKRRNDENAVLDEVIAIFHDKVNGVSSYIRERVEDYRGDKKFDETDLQSRRIDNQVEKDTKKVYENTYNEASTA